MNEFKYLKMYDCRDTDKFFEFLESHKIKYDYTSTGDVNYEGEEELDIYITMDNKEISELVKNYLCNE